MLRILVSDLFELEMGKRRFYSIVAFVGLFTYLYPVSLKVLPLDTDEILHLCGLGYWIFVKRGYLPMIVCRYIVIMLALVFIAFLFTSLFNNANDFSLVKLFILYALAPFSALMIVDLIKRAKITESLIYKVLEWIVYASFLQSLISFAMFFSPPLKDHVLNIIAISERQSDFMNEMSTFRLLAFSYLQYANIAVIYGISLFIMVALRFSKRNIPIVKSRLRYWVVLLVIVLAGIFTARTFFLMMALSIAYFYYLYYKKYGMKVVAHAPIVIMIAALLFYGFQLFVKESEYGESYRWAFEWYINFSESGNVDTESTKDLEAMYHIIPDNMNTWLLGDGRMVAGDVFYKNVDAGYLRNIFYWGIIGTVIFYFFHWKIYRLIRTYTSDVNMRRLYALILLWLFIYAVKESWTPNVFWALFVAAIAYNRVKSCKFSNVCVR